MTPFLNSISGPTCSIYRGPIGSWVGRTNRSRRPGSWRHSPAANRASSTMPPARWRRSSHELRRTHVKPWPSKPSGRFERPSPPAGRTPPRPGVIRNSTRSAAATTSGCCCSTWPSRPTRSPAEGRRTGRRPVPRRDKITGLAGRQLASVGLTEASNGVLARVGRIERSVERCPRARRSDRPSCVR
jgi:hypothetical protein